MASNSEPLTGRAELLDATETLGKLADELAQVRDPQDLIETLDQAQATLDRLRALA